MRLLLGNTIVKIILISLGIKLSYLFMVFIINYNTEYGFWEQTIFSKNKESIIKSTWYKNDTGWYLDIAKNGYKAMPKDSIGFCDDRGIKQSSYAFFPLFPVSIYTFSELFNLKLYQSGFWLSWLLSTIAFIVGYYTIYVFAKNKQIAFTSICLIILFPFHFYYSIPYTESLFLSLLGASFLSIYYKKYSLFALAASGLVLVRPNGLVMLLPLALYFLERNNLSLLPKNIYNKPKNYLALLLFIIPVIIFLTFCYYEYTLTGDFFAFKTAQKGWCKDGEIFFWNTLLKSNNLNEIYNSAYTTLVLLFLTLLFYKLPLSLTILSFIGILMPLVAGTSVSMHRYISVVFPVFMLLAYYIYKFNTQLKSIIFILLFTSHLVSYWFWLKDNPLSY